MNVGFLKDNTDVGEEPARRRNPGTNKPGPGQEWPSPGERKVWPNNGRGRGRYIFYVRAIDPAGNRDNSFEEGRNMYTWLYQPAPPGWTIFLIVMAFLITGLTTFLLYRRWLRKMALERYAVKKMRRKFKEMARDEAADARADAKKLYEKFKEEEAADPRNKKRLEEKAARKRAKKMAKDARKKGPKEKRERKPRKTEDGERVRRRPKYPDGLQGNKPKRSDVLGAKQKRPTRAGEHAQSIQDGARVKVPGKRK